MSWLNDEMAWQRLVDLVVPRNPAPSTPTHPSSGLFAATTKFSVLDLLWDVGVFTKRDAVASTHFASDPPLAKDAKMLFGDAADRTPITPSTCDARVRELCKRPTLRDTGHRKSVQSRFRMASWHHRCVTPIRTAQALANNSLVPQSSLRSVRIPKRFATDGHRDAEWSYQPALLHGALASRTGCIVYSFGVAQRDEFTSFYASSGCQVFAFDPTVNHSVGMHKWMRNVSFHPWGLQSTARHSSDERKMTGWQYGQVFGELLSFSEIVNRLGHGPDTPIHALKLDCEGCEFLTFKELFCGGATLPTIYSISIELHFWVALRMEQSDDVERIRYAGLYLKQHGFRTVTFKEHTGALYPYRGEMVFVHPDLVAAGLPYHTCCYMYSFVRDEAARTDLAAY